MTRIFKLKKNISKASRANSLLVTKLLDKPEKTSFIELNFTFAFPCIAPNAIRAAKKSWVLSCCETFSKKFRSGIFSFLSIFYSICWPSSVTFSLMILSKTDFISFNNMKIKLPDSPINKQRTKRVYKTPIKVWELSNSEISSCIIIVLSY